MTVEKRMVLAVGLNIVTYVPVKSFSGCSGLTDGTWVLSPATPPTNTLPSESRRGALIVSAALRSGRRTFPTKVDQTSAVPVGLSLARKPRFKHRLLVGQGVEFAVPAVAGKL